MDQNQQAIAIIGNYFPRKCGIATFTTDLCNAIAKELPNEKDLIAVAMNDIDSGYDYPDRVKFEIRANVPADYLRAADFIHGRKVQVAILQHEYGIFGGEYGTTIFQLLKNLNIPIITTLHTTLPEPDEQQKAVIIELSKICDRLVVMSDKAQELLMDVYKIKKDKVMVIPHGIPDVPLRDSSFYKDQFGVEGRKVILTFGLLGPGKGLETMIEAMPRIVEQHSDVVYIILGATHPHIVRGEGEEYRHKLQRRIRELRVEANVMFFNQFVELDTLLQFIGATDVYVTPYPFKGQIVSGTLSYALGAGKAVVSTPYLYAEEMLKDGRGKIVPFENPELLGNAISELLSSNRLRKTMGNKAYRFCRPRIWEETARSYLSLAIDCQKNHRLKPSFLPKNLNNRKLETLPRVNIDHLLALTDDTGIFQHARYSIANREHGYCLDDVTRGLIALVMYTNRKNESRLKPVIKTYLSFINHAYDPKSGTFRNFMSYERKWLPSQNEESAQARVIWSLGLAMDLFNDKSVVQLMRSLFTENLERLESMKHPRSWAFCLIGLDHYANKFSGDDLAKKVYQNLALKLFQLFKDNIKSDWMWFEDTVTYNNAKLPHALILAGHRLDRSDMMDLGINILKWLLKIQTSKEGHISLIGNSGWMVRGGDRAQFGQQPIEIMALTETCGEIYRITHDQYWFSEARRCFDWFLGRNDFNVSLYDFKTGGGYDGLEQSGPNQNMGAESTIAWLISLLTMYQLIDYQTISGFTSSPSNPSTSN